jgi:hypothetical protein
VNATPAFCSVCGRYAWRVLDEKWDGLFATIFKNEAKIYAETFRVYVVAPQLRAGRHTAFRFFQSSMTALKNSFWSNETEFDEGMREAFRGYWNLALAAEYWKPNCHKTMDGWLDHNSALDVWRSREANVIQDWKTDLDTWRSDNLK